MKNIHRTINSGVIKLLLIYLVIVCNLSCKKNGSGSFGEVATVNIQLNGALFGVAKNGDKPKVSSRSVMTVEGSSELTYQSAILHSEVSLGNGLTLVGKAIPVTSDYNDVNASISNEKRLASNAQIRDLANDVTYEVLAYNTFGSLVGRQVYQVGNTLTEVPFKDAELMVGGTYTFVAYSNGTNTLPVLAETSTLSSTSIALTNNNQYLYWKVDAMTLSEGMNLLNINLAHQFCQVKSVRFNVADGVLVGQNISTVSDLSITSHTGITASLDGSINFGSEVGVFTIPSNGAIGGRSYTAIAATPIIVAVESVVDPAFNTSFRIGTLSIGGVFKNDLSVNFAFQAGTHYDIELTISSFADDGVNINGLIWARGNLWYDDSDVNNHYKIRRNASVEPVNSQDFWRFGTTTPSGTSHDPNYDPCAQVLPANTWRMPTKSEFQSLGATNAGVSSRYYGNLNPILAAFTSTPIQLFATWSNPDAANRPLLINIDGRLSANGVNRRTYTPLLPGTPGAPGLTGSWNEGKSKTYNLLAIPVAGASVLNQITGRGMYWTSEVKSDNPNYVRFEFIGGELAGLNLLNLNVVQIGLLSGSNLSYAYTGSFGTSLNANGNAAGLGVGVPAWQNRLMIRCVRPLNGG